MTTSDDQPRYTDDAAVTDTTHGDPLGDDLSLAAPAAARPGAGRMALAILLALAVAAVGVAVWAYIYVQAEKEYVGVSVVVGLLVGYVIRLVSGRSSIPARLVAVLITAVTCVVGTIAAEAAFTANTYRADFVTLFTDILPDSFELLKRRPALTLAIFVAALVLAFMSASPQQPSKKKRRADAAVDGDEPPVSPVMPLDDDDDNPPPRIAAG